MKETLLLTGANGFIGRHLYHVLSQAYHVVRLVWPQEVASEGDKCFAVDLSDAKAVEGLISSLPVVPYRAIIHLAAVLCRPGDWDNIAYFDLNNAITKNMIRVAKAISCANFINFSSLAVYPNETGLYDEKSVVDMVNNTECLYGLAKFNSEMLFRYYLKSSMNVINLRVTQVFGPGMQEERLIGSLAKELREKDRITLFGKGERESNFVFVSDVVQAVLAVLKNPVAGTYNLGHEKSHSYLEMARGIVAQLGSKNSKIIFEEKGISAKVKIDARCFEKQFQCVCRSWDLSFLKKGNDK